MNSDISKVKKKQADVKLLIRLFFETFKLSAFTFGGGFVIVSLMKKRFIEKFGWIDETSMLDYVSIAQSSPGAIAVNISILVGYHIAGIIGAATTVLATITPPLITLSIVSLLYKAFIENIYVAFALSGMTAGVAAVIVDVVIGLAVSIWRDSKWFAVIMSIAAFACVAFLGVNVIYIILVCALIGIFYFGFSDKRKKKDGGGSIC